MYVYVLLICDTEINQSINQDKNEPKRSVSGRFEQISTKNDGVHSVLRSVIIRRPSNYSSCGGPKKSPRTSSIVQIIFFF